MKKKGRLACCSPCQTLGWMKHKLESKIAGRNINNLRYAYGSTPMEERKEELMKVKEESEKVGFQIAKIMASSPITLCQTDGEKMETERDFFSWDPKSLQMVTATMKLKGAYSLKEML